MPFEAFPLLDFRQGIDQGRKPWIAPADTWSDLQNCHLERGRLVKRRGIQYLSQLGTKATHAVGSSGSTTYTGTLTNHPLLPKEASPSTYKVTFTDGTLVVTDNGAGALTGNGTGTINYTTGAFSVTFSGATTGAVTCAYEYLRNTVSATQNAVMHVGNFVQESGTETLLAIDRRRAFKWSASEKRFYDFETTGDRWPNATLEDFPWVAEYRNSLAIVNGVDTCVHYDAGSGTIKEISSDWLHGKNVADGGYARSLDTALIVVIYRGRAIFLRTKESGTTCFRRARWTKVDPNFDDYASFRQNDWTDAPTNDRIVSAGFVRNDLIVWMEGPVGGSVWRLAPQDDPRQPFFWVRIDPNEGGVATKATVSGADLCATIGPSSIVATDGQTARKIDKQTPEAVIGWNQSKVGMCFGIRFDELRQHWFTYAARDESYPSHVLAFQWDDEAFATYDLPFHCLGFWKQQNTNTWDGMDSFFATFDAATTPFDAVELQSSFPVLLGGARDQKIYYASFGYSDDGAYYFMRAKTQRLNPYPNKATTVRLGWVDVVAQRNDDGILNLRFYRDFDESPYRTEYITLDGDSSKDQVRKRIRVNCTAQSHRVEVVDFAGSAIVVDSLIAYMRPEGPARSVS